MPDQKTRIYKCQCKHCQRSLHVTGDKVRLVDPLLDFEETFDISQVVVAPRGSMTVGKWTMLVTPKQAKKLLAAGARHP